MKFPISTVCALFLLLVCGCSSRNNPNSPGASGGGGTSGEGGGKFSCEYSSPHTCVDYVGFSAGSAMAVKSTCSSIVQKGKVGGGCDLTGAVAGCQYVTMSYDKTTQIQTTWHYDGTVDAADKSCASSATLISPTSMVISRDGGAPDSMPSTPASSCDTELAALNIKEWRFSRSTGGSPEGIVAGSDGKIWFTLGYSSAKEDSIGNITVDGTKTTLFPLLTPPDQIGNSVAHEIASGPDNNLWVTETTVSKIAKVTPLGMVTEFPVPVTGRIVFDTAGTPWAIADYLAGTIVHMGTDGSNATYATLLSGSYPDANHPPTQAWSIAAGLNSDVWVFADARGAGPNGEVFHGASGFQHITSNGVLTWYRISTFVPGNMLNPGVGKDMVVGPDKNIWTLFDKEIGKFTPGDKVIETYMSFPISISGFTRSGVKLTVGPDGNLWFSETKTGELSGLVFVTPTGQIKEISWSDKCGSPVDITSGPDGNIWFAMAGVGVSENQFGGIARLKLAP